MSLRFLKENHHSYFDWLPSDMINIIEHYLKLSNCFFISNIDGKCIYLPMFKPDEYRLAKLYNFMRQRQNNFDEMHSCVRIQPETFYESFKLKDADYFFPRINYRIKKLDLYDYIDKRYSEILYIRFGGYKPSVCGYIPIYTGFHLKMKIYDKKSIISFFKPTRMVYVEITQYPEIIIKRGTKSMGYNFND